ncbi:NACHT, LRR and PYD domains-containing protein 12-like [Xenentodon cancila]
MDHSEDREEEVPSSKSTSPGENEDQSKAQRKEKERPADQPLLQDDKDPEDPEDPEDPAVSAETINKIRPKFVNGVSIEILKQLIDLLLSEGVLSCPEKEDILEKNQTRADKARDFIDCVTKKGPEACRMMLKHLQSKDPTLSRHLGLYLDPTVRKGLLQTCQRQLKSNLTNRVECVFEGTATRGNSTLLNDIYTELFITEGETTEVNNEHEFRPSLDFLKTKTINDPRKTTSVKVLLTSLIRGNLLPSARVWITTRPAAANQIPPEYVDVVTEVRGFTDPQKEEYFRKRFRDESSMIISHIRTSRSIHIMCHIPVFCWITATVLEDVMKAREGGGLPKTLTEMYIHFLVVQTKLKKVKYDEEPATDQESRKMMEHLGKLAFEQLQKGHLIFYQSDLKESGINFEEAAVCSGVFTEIFKTVKGLYQDKAFCFIHLSVQEFLAALYVHMTFIESGVNLLKLTNPLRTFMTSKQDHFYQNAVDNALKSPNGHLDLFLRFLLGLSLETNQNHLQGMLIQKGSSHDVEKTAQYIKKKIKKLKTAEESINLFHCLNELNDRSLVEEIQQFLNSGCLSTDKLSPAQWSALVFILLSSDKDLEVFDLRKYLSSEEALLRLLPVVKASKKVLLSDCNLSEEVCAGLSSVLSSQSSSLTELDLSNNHLQDSGLKKLCPGLESPHCKLESLRLSDCNLSEDVCAGLSSVLSSQSSSLTELDLSNNHLQDSGLKKLCPGLESPHCKGCNLSEEVCAGLSSVLSSQSSSLTELDLSNNHLQDSGLEKLCPGLESPHCKLESLRLSGCLLTSDGCASLVSALSSNPSHLRELDLSYNHPGESAVKLQSAGLEDPRWRLDTLSCPSFCPQRPPTSVARGCRITLNVHDAAGSARDRQ